MNNRNYPHHEPRRPDPTLLTAEEGELRNAFAYNPYWMRIVALIILVLVIVGLVVAMLIK